MMAKPSCTYQVSEHASWSAGYYGRMINNVLAAGGAPPDLVQFVTGYAEAGNALVTGGGSSGFCFVQVVCRVVNMGAPLDSCSICDRLRGGWQCAGHWRWAISFLSCIQLVYVAVYIIAKVLKWS